MFFVLQTYETVTKLAKICLKTQLKNNFSNQAKTSAPFGEKIIFWTEVLRENHYENFAKKPNFISAF